MTDEVVELDMDSSHGRQYRGMESILRHMARRDQRYLSLWLQWVLSRPNSAFRDEVVAANHASVPVNVLEALAREMLENATTEDPLETHAAQTLLEAVRREKETLVKVPLMPLEAVAARCFNSPRRRALGKEYPRPGARKYMSLRWCKAKKIWSL